MPTNMSKSRIGNELSKTKDSAVLESSKHHRNDSLILPYRLEELLPYTQCTIITYLEDTQDVQKYTQDKKQQIERNNK